MNSVCCPTLAFCDSAVGLTEVQWLRCQLQDQVIGRGALDLTLSLLRGGFALFQYFDVPGKTQHHKNTDNG